MCPYCPSIALLMAATAASKAGGVNLSAALCSIALISVEWALTDPAGQPQRYPGGFAGGVALPQLHVAYLINAHS